MTRSNAARVRIGTSGWHYPHWRATYYPRELSAAKWLDFYSARFSSVELNNSFYRLPTRAMFEAWAERVPGDFLFAVKASRYITHLKKLNLDRQGLTKFFEAIEGLGRQLGPIVFQLPPRWRLNLERFERFLEALPPGYRYAFELRDPSWHTASVLRALEAHAAAFCLYELAGFETPLLRTADFVYVRLHGPGASYQGQYTLATLQGWAQRCSHWRDEGVDVFVYFDNDERGYAARNAEQLAALLNAKAEIRPLDGRVGWPTSQR